jgi:primosomal protein N' (replication factor Y) (superfamily II helicase)
VETLNSFVDVILPLPAPGTYTYHVPPGLEGQAVPGVRVVVQFGPRKVFTALVRRVHATPPTGYTPKQVLSILDETPVVAEQQFVFWEWIASYYLCHIGEVMNAALPSVLKLASETKIMLNPDWNGDLMGMSEREQILMTALQYRDKPVDISEASKILELHKVIPLVRTMIEKGIVLLEEEIREKLKPKVEKIITLDPGLGSDEGRMKELFDTLERKAGKQLEVLMAFLHLTGFRTGAEASLPRPLLLKEIPGSAAVIDTLVKKGVFTIREEQVSRLQYGAAGSGSGRIRFSPAQKHALETIRTQFKEKDVVLLHGVTSSGKTEMYVQLIAETIGRGKQALYLLPEIALTTQIINRLRKFFGDKIGIYHSRLNEQERAEVWKNTLERKYDIILGARSAVFLPFSDLGLVIVDEEHDYSFKQVDPAPRYHARDAALYLSHLHKASSLLGSATPSLESYFLTKQGRYGLVELRERYGDLEMPSIRVVDIKDEVRHGKMKTHFTSVLMKQLEEVLTNHEQAILFQNRRGFSLRLECETCHWMPMCKNCDVTLVYHKKSNQLRCHYCGYVARIPEKCPECNGTALRMKGFGTERVEEDLQILFPKARITRMDLDTTRGKHAHQKIITDFEERKIDFLVGTQMVTKGLDFDHVSTVCILNADNMLSYPDFRSAERGFQLMEQVSGRAGRRKKQGSVIIQTWQPDHPIIRDVLNHDFNSMYNRQVADRSRFKYPPFYRIIMLRLKHRDPEALNKAARHFADELRTVFGSRILGPEYPTVARIMNYYIKQIMVKLERGGNLLEMKEKLSESITRFGNEKASAGVRIVVDVDPL